MSNDVTCQLTKASAQKNIPIITSTQAVDSSWTGLWVLVSTAANTTLTMPDATTHLGCIYHFMRTSETTGSLTLATVSAQTINIYDVTNGSISDTSITSPAGQPCAVIHLMSDGVNWNGTQVAAGNWS
jgi:hypothetical protein